MKILYIYDLFAKNPKEYNRIKRMFYYYLNQFFDDKKPWITESCILAENTDERHLDALFKKFRKNAVVYKTPVKKLRKLK